MTAKRKIAKCGGSLVIRISKDIAGLMGVDVDDEVELNFDGEQLCIRKVEKK